MADTALLDPNTASLVEEKKSTEQETGTQEAGEDLGLWNERLDEDLQNVLLKLLETYCDQFRYPRRLEIAQAWRGRMFWREMQHLKWNWEGECWDLAIGPAAYDGKSDATRDSAVLYSTNIFQGFGDSFIAIITQSIPSLRFEPEDPDEPADIETARASESLRKLVQHENDPVKLMTKAAYFSWTDGRIHGWTRWETDKRTGKARETQSIEGSMEVKVPVTADCQEEFLYLIYSKEYDLATVRAKVKARNFPDLDYWKKIKAGSSGTGQTMYERTARISVKQGISMKSAGGDAYSTLVTTQRAWLRPAAFLDDKVEEQYREKLQALFPNGCYIEADNGTYTGSRNANMDDEWAVENVMEGDGQFRNAKGTCLISVQERYNDDVNCAQDTYEKCQPASHWDDKLWDVDAMRRQKSMPGSRNGVNMKDLPAGDTLQAHFAFEPAAVVSADMLGFIKELGTEIPEFLTGIAAILFGADTGGDKSGKALAVQQAAAMGRVGLPFRMFKRFYAKMMEQAVRCASRNRKEDTSIGIPDEKGNVETITVRVGDIDGKVRCYPSSDENYPVSWSQQKVSYQQLFMEGSADPAIRATLALPKNQELAKKLIGLPDLEIAGADSWNKQMQEINLMLQEPPTVVQPPPEPVPNPLVPGAVAVMQPPPQPRSSLPIDPDFDDHQAEWLTVKLWANSAAGQKIKKEDAVGFANVCLHGIAHRDEAAKQAAAAMPPPQPPMNALRASGKAPNHVPGPGGPPEPIAAPAGA